MGLLPDDLLVVIIIIAVVFMLLNGSITVANRVRDDHWKRVNESDTLYVPEPEGSEESGLTRSLGRFFGVRKDDA